LANTGYYDEDVELVSEKFLDYNPFDFEDISAKDRQIIDTLLNDPKTSVEELANIIGETPKETQERIDRLVENGLLEVDGEEVEVTDEGEEAAEESGETEKTELITVYKYVKRPDAPSLEGESRDFCRRMVALSRDKSWTYEQINNTRFTTQGGRGVGNNAQGTDLFTKRGGWYTNPNTGTRTPFCRHIWSSRTVRVKKEK
jgi:DNA-binding MarR family transcriptional regulator